MRNETKSHWQTESELKEEIKSILDKGYNTVSMNLFKSKSLFNCLNSNPA